MERPKTNNQQTILLHSTGGVYRQQVQWWIAHSMKANLEGASSCWRHRFLNRICCSSRRRSTCCRPALTTIFPIESLSLSLSLSLYLSLWLFVRPASLADPFYKYHSLWVSTCYRHCIENHFNWTYLELNLKMWENLSQKRMPQKSPLECKPLRTWKRKTNANYQKTVYGIRW